MLKIISWLIRAVVALLALLLLIYWLRLFFTYLASKL